ncbi:hypothetical protein [Kluyvera sp. 142486]|uniref:hypothetical protein n=1 Tax=Kluyvera sp. 142486 TaxID=3390050 RepID=UPI003980280E
MAYENGIPHPEVQISDIAAPLPFPLMTIVNKKNEIVKQPDHIQAQINELSKRLLNLNNTALDNLANELNTISTRFETFRASLLICTGEPDKK